MASRRKPISAYGSQYARSREARFVQEGLNQRLFNGRGAAQNPVPF
jgi:hypothetical protein